MSCFTEKLLVQFVKNHDVSTKLQKNQFSQEFATQVSWQKVDERTGAEIPDEDIIDGGTTPGGGGDTPGDGSDDLEG